jgi:hypothetical protein
MPSPTRYRVQIHADGKLYKAYRTDGAATISAAANPMRAAALDLLSRGAPPDAVLSGSFEGAMISPVALSRLAKPYSPPRLNHRDGAGGRNVD